MERYKQHFHKIPVKLINLFNLSELAVDIIER